MYNNILNKPNYWIPYSAVNEFYQNIEFNYNPKNKILISGIRDNTYPFRQKLHKNVTSSVFLYLTKAWHTSDIMGIVFRQKIHKNVTSSVFYLFKQANIRTGTKI
jgi:hypothetical protein